MTTRLLSTYDVRMLDDDARDLPADSPRWRAILAHSHPAYTFERIQTALAPKWSATASHLGVHPWCVVTSDPREFGIHLPATSANGHD